LIPAILQDSALAFVTGIFALICGAVLLAAHHHWSSATAIVISLLGVLTIVRGVGLMLAPDLLAAFAAQMLSSGAGPIVAGVIALLLGAWLTFAGWFTSTPQA
jgi:hypothetical protein